MAENHTEEILLLTCSEHLTYYNLEQLAGMLHMMVVTVDGELYPISSIRIDEAEHKIYGRGIKMAMHHINVET